MAMTCYMHEQFEQHDPGYGHPERPQRYAAVRRAVAAAGAPIVEAEPAPREALERVHTPAYLDLVERFCAEVAAPWTRTPWSARSAGRLRCGPRVGRSQPRRKSQAARPGRSASAVLPATTRSPPARWASASSTAPRSPPHMPATCSAGAGRGARLGRPPRQRHAGDILPGSQRAVRLAAPVPVLSGVGSGVRARFRGGRGRDGEPAAPGRVRGGAVPAGVSRAGAGRVAAVPARIC